MIFYLILFLYLQVVFHFIVQKFCSNYCLLFTFFSQIVLSSTIHFCIVRLLWGVWDYQLVDSTYTCRIHTQELSPVRAVHSRERTVLYSGYSTGYGVVTLESARTTYTYCTALQSRSRSVFMEKGQLRVLPYIIVPITLIYCKCKGGLLHAYIIGQVTVSYGGP